MRGLHALLIQGHTPWMPTVIPAGSAKAEKMAGQVLSQRTNFVHPCLLPTVMGHLEHSNMKRASTLGHERLLGQKTTSRGRGQ